MHTAQPCAPRLAADLLPIEPVAARPDARLVAHDARPLGVISTSDAARAVPAHRAGGDPAVCNGAPAGGEG